jgi:hypothetical protein
MKRTILLSTATLVALMMLTAYAGEQDFVLVNETGLTIDAFYCSPTTTNDWEEDVLGEDILADEGSVEIRFARDTEACQWDLMIVDEDGDKIVWANIDLCETAKITLFYKDGKPTALIENAEDEDEEEEETE